MKFKHVAIGIITLILILIGFVAFAWKNRPELIDVHPDDNASNVPVTSQIRLEFSQPMERVSVISHITITPAQDGKYRWDGNLLIFTPDQSWPSGQEVNVSLAEGTKAASWLALPMRGESWSFSTREASLAYLWPSDGPSDIYALNPVTGEVHPYTHRMGVLEFTSSNDGIKIYFSSSNIKGGSDLYELDLIEESNTDDNFYQPKKLLDCGSSQCRSPGISFDNKLLAYERLIPNPMGGLGPAQIWLLSIPDLDGELIGQATHETIQPVWSSTGWLAFYDQTSQVYEVINPATKVRFQLINQTGQPGNWSPDGQYYLAPEMMYYPSTDDTETGISHLLQYSIDAETSGDLSKADNVEDVEGHYSPDGGSIAFARKYLDMEQWSFGRQIWIMNADGSNPHPITDEPDYNHYDLSWSWDSLRLAYVRFNEAKKHEPVELWMIDSNGKNPVQLVIGGYSPVWIP
jgi:Tol biopolymer transport system component